MCRPEFENWGLKERPLTENGGLSERPLTVKRGGGGVGVGGGRGMGTINNKETFIFFKGGLLEQPMSERWNKQMHIFEKGCLSESGPGRKNESLGATQAEKWGAFGRHIPVLP